MRIFYAAHSSATFAPNSKVWDYNLLLPLIDLGHDVIRFDYDLDVHIRDPWLRRHGRPKLERALFDQVGAAVATGKVDLFFSYFDASMITPAALGQIRRLGIVTVNWYCNSSYQFEKIAPIAPAYDYCLVPEKFRIADYRRVGARPIYCQEAANPNFYKPYPGEFLYDVSFVGQKYGDRALLVQRLIDAGIRVHVFGPGWISDKRPQATLLERLLSHTPRSLAQSVLGRLRHKPNDALPIVNLPEEFLHQPLSDEDMVKTFSRSKINLGFSSCGNTAFGKERITQVRLRDFEIPLSGGFSLTEYMPELGEFFELGREVICYQGASDLVDKVKHYLAHDQEREAVRVAGYQRALRDHTWQKRLKQAFAEMKLH